MSESSLTSLQLAKARVIATVAAPLIGGLCRTLTWKVEGAEHYDAIINAGKQPILACWHGRILTGLYYFRHRGIVALASQNFDGEWIARILERFGYTTARGSTSRGGARALVQLRRELAAGHGVAFTVDGPRGPARVAQAGAVWLAGATGQPDSSISPRGRSVLDDEELGPGADAEAVEYRSRWCWVSRSTCPGWRKRTMSAPVQKSSARSRASRRALAAGCWGREYSLSQKHDPVQR